MPVKFNALGTNAPDADPAPEAPGNAPAEAFAAELTAKALLPETLDPKWDRLGELLQWAAEIKADPRTEELEALKKEAVAMWAETQGKDQSGSLQTSNGRIEFKKGNNRAGEVDAKAFHKAVGNGVFYACAKVSAGDVKKYVSEPLQGPMIGPGKTDNPSITGFIPGIASEQVF